MAEVSRVFAHVILAVSFFYILNWIGRHTVSLGYLQLSIFARQDEAPAFNFILRTVSPTVYIILLSAIFYAFGEENLVKSIWCVVPFYFIFRALYNIAFGRSKLIDWKSFIIQFVVASALSYFIYDKLILTKIYILPNADNLASELWLIIILFLYFVFNKVQTSSEGTRRRKLHYLTKQYSCFKKKYGKYVSKTAVNEHIQYLTYAIMIYENFGRPRILRAVESLIPRKALTRGLMQVRSKKRITDQQSVAIALKKLNTDYKASLVKVKAENKSWIKRHGASEAQKMFTNVALRKTIVSYNKDKDYLSEVYTLVDELRALDMK